MHINRTAVPHKPLPNGAAFCTIVLFQANPGPDDLEATLLRL
jgi:hypothetical protein